ncbi:hypothetical protein Q2T76_01495 [Lactobacillus sp. YT155]|uniref:hypothetical protein n=1 Tax=Lactobacillus sp. YT155 TaxID=3060955 RepID=UPI00265F6CA8|nr:hypothetical protein [Lactobacillus sp. YT155]MDO1604725.1 hypothetical protein [Lactobacillus sp. YT155]
MKKITKSSLLSVFLTLFLLIAVGCSNNSSKEKISDSKPKVEKKETKPKKEIKKAEEPEKIDNKHIIIMAWQKYQGSSLDGYHYYMNDGKYVLQQPQMRATIFTMDSANVTLLPIYASDEPQTISIEELKKNYYSTPEQKQKTDSLVNQVSDVALVNGDLPN